MSNFDLIKTINHRNELRKIQCLDDPRIDPKEMVTGCKKHKFSDGLETDLFFVRIPNMSKEYILNLLEKEDQPFSELYGKKMFGNKRLQEGNILKITLSDDTYTYTNNAKVLYLQVAWISSGRYEMVSDSVTIDCSLGPRIDVLGKTIEEIILLSEIELGCILAPYAFNNRCILECLYFQLEPEYSDAVDREPIYVFVKELPILVLEEVDFKIDVKQKVCYLPF